jgi:hypothetical protein
MDGKKPMATGVLVAFGRMPGESSPVGRFFTSCTLKLFGRYA